MKFNNPFKKGNKMTEQNQTPENAENAAKNQETVPPTYEELQQRTAELEAQLKEADLRLMANEQNLRRRHQEEIQAAHKFAAQKFATEMLAVKDYLEMAMKDESGNAEAMKMGVGMTLNELNRAFEAAQIKEIPAQQGDKLDPHRHQAIQRMKIALSEMVVEGINTNIALHRDLMEDKRFNEGGTSIHYLEKLLAETKRSS